MKRWFWDWVRSGISLMMALAICISLLPADAFAKEPDSAADTGNAIAEESMARQAGGKFRVAVRSAAPRSVSGAFDWPDDTKNRAKAIWERMSDEEKIGQLFLIQTGNSNRIVYGEGKITEWVSDYQPAGLVLFAADFEGKTLADAAAFKEKIERLQGLSGLGLIISADEEGGSVTRASKGNKYGHEEFKSPQALKEEAEASGMNALEHVREDAADKAAFLKSLGVNLNFTPVADTSVESGYIYGRTWGGDYAGNTDYVAAAVRGMEDAGLGTAVKHLPNYGPSGTDGHGKPIEYDTPKDKEDLMANDIKPFAAGIDVGCRMVMMTHNAYTSINSENKLPESLSSSLSPAVYNILREDLGFKGVAVTDSLAMSSVSGSGSPALAALVAGADLVMINGTDLASAANPVEAVRDAVNTEGSGFTMEDVKTRVLRVLCWKIEHGILGIRDEIDIGPDDEAVYSLPGGAASASGSFDEMWAMAAESGGTVTLLKDVTAEGNTSDGNRVISKKITLDLDGHTLSHTGTSEEFFKVVDGGVFTIDDKNHEASVSETLIPLGEVKDAAYDAEDRTVTYYVPDADQENMAIEYVADASSCGTILVNGESSELKSNRVLEAV